MIWLRASQRQQGEAEDFSAVAGAADGGVRHGRLLTGFAEAVLGGDEAALAQARSALRAAAGPAAFADAAAVVALFNAIDRVADATGTPLEPAKREDSADFRAALGIDAFPAARGKL